MNMEDRRSFIRRFRSAAQKARSVMYESAEEHGESKDAVEIMGEKVSPWLFGARCILPHLDKMEVEPTDTDIVNLNYILGHTPAIAVAGVAYGLHELDPLEILK